jgi:uncharacterized phiE125 gp8 family phage protein
MLYLIEPPDNDAVLSLAEAKDHLRVTFSDEDELIAGYIAAAIANIDGRDGWLGRALAAQTWELRLHAFNGPEIMLPLPPLIAVESLKYFDSADTLQEIPAGDYEVVGAGGFGKGRLVLKSGKAWPGIAKRAENVQVRFRAGYVTADSPPVGSVPAPILAALKRQVADFYANREPVVIGASVARLPGAVEALLAPLRIWS